MRFEVRETTGHPRPRVWAAHRDRLEDIARLLPDVERVELRSRSRHAGGREEQQHRWTGRPAVLPATVRPFVPPHLLTWTQRTVWDPHTWTATWTIEVPALGPAVEASGRNVYLEEAGACVIALDGDFAFKPDQVPQLKGVPAAAVPMVEKLVVSMIVPLVRRSGEAVATWLSREGG